MRAPARPAPPPASIGAAARLISLAPGLYAFTLAGTLAGDGHPVPGAPIQAMHVAAVHVAAPPAGAAEITDGFGRAGSWLGGGRDVLLVKAPAGGGAALATAYLPEGPERPPAALRIRRIDPPGTPPVTLTIAPETAAPLPPPASLEVVAHVSGRGDVRFVDAPWIGRLGPGTAIEAFTLLPRDPAVAAAIECKALSAGGAETAWLAAGVPCGTSGRAVPLIGFAIRQKQGAGGALFDCEYAGYFRSGATAGPVRNGAPCRSPSGNDPLEGMQVRITARPLPA